MRGGVLNKMIVLKIVSQIMDSPFDVAYQQAEIVPTCCSSSSSSRLDLIVRRCTTSTEYCVRRTPGHTSILESPFSSYRGTKDARAGFHTPFKCAVLRTCVFVCSCSDALDLETE
jgi:hypothetical protein